MANIPKSGRTSLWSKATALAGASDRDFHEPNRRPPGVKDEHLKIINDTALRSRLIMAGIAEGLQSPKGPQKIPSIIRLYPNFDAPAPRPAIKRGRPSTAADAPPRAAYGLPTIEELHALLERVRITEAEVSRELHANINADIDRLKRQIATLEGEAFDRAFRELDAAVAARKQLSAQVREEAFSRIDADPDFAPRKFLRLISRDARG